MKCDYLAPCEPIQIKENFLNEQVYSDLDAINGNCAKCRSIGLGFSHDITGAMFALTNGKRLERKRLNPLRLLIYIIDDIDNFNFFHHFPTATQHSRFFKKYLNPPQTKNFDVPN